jgi:signal transduction histidine kinase
MKASLEREVGSLGRYSLLVRYGVAVVAVALAIGLKLALDPLFAGHQSPFLMLAGAVMVAAWFGGLGPGLSATALGALAADYFFLSPIHAFTPPGRPFLPLLLFVAQGVLISALAQALRSARERAEKSSLEAQRRALENARLYEELAAHERELQELVRRIFVAQEDERRRVAYDIHDGLTQMAAAAYRQLELFVKHRPPDAAQDREELEDAVALVRQTVGEARRIIANLRPTTLDDFGLATAVRMSVDDLRAEGFEVSYEETLGEKRLPATLETALFRVAQEALANVRKHAQTERVHISLGRRDDGVVHLEVRDWGRGFKEPASAGQRNAGPGERVGLSSMQERVTLLGGRFEVRSEPGKGTSVLAEVPVQQSMLPEKGF